MRRLLRFAQKAIEWFVWAFVHAAYVLYLLVFRSFLYLLTAYSVVWFWVGTTGFQDMLHEVLDESLPGAIEMDTLQWGPVPWQVRIVGVQITEPDETPVIEAERVYAEVDLLGLLGWVAQEGLRSVGFGETHRPTDGFAMHITSAHVEGYRVLLDFRSDSGLGLVRAFVDKTPRDERKAKAGVDILITDALGQNGQCTLLFPLFEMRYEGISFGSSTVHVRPQGTSVAVPKLTVASGTARFELSGRPSEHSVLEIPIEGAQLTGYVLDHDRFRLRDLNARVGTSSVSLAGGMGFQKDSPVTFDGAMQLMVPEDEPLRRFLLDDALKGFLALRVSGGGPVTHPRINMDLAATTAELKGLPLRELYATGYVHRQQLGSVWEMGVDHLEAEVGGGHAMLSAATWEPKTGVFSALLNLKTVSPVEVLTSPIASMEREPLQWLEGEVTGEVGVHGSWRKDATQLHVDTAGDALQFAPDPSGIPWPEPLDFRGGVDLRFRGDGALLLARKLRISTGSATLTLDGSHDLQQGRTRAAADLVVDDLERLAVGWGVEGVSGSLQVSSGELVGSRPDLLGAELVAQDVQVKGIPLGGITGGISFVDGVLRLVEGQIKGDLGDARFDASAGLFPGEDSEAESTFPFDIARLVVKNTPVAAVLDGAKGVLSLDTAELSGRLTDLPNSLKGRGFVRASGITGLGEPIQSASGMARISGGVVALTKGLVTLATGDALHIDDAEYTLASGRLRGRIGTPGIHLDRLRALKRVAEIRGHVAGQLDVDMGAGPATLEGGISIRNLRIGGASLGDAELGLAPRPDRTIEIEAIPFFKGTKLSKGASVRMTPNGSVRKGNAMILFDSLDVASIVSSLDSEEWRVLLTGELAIAHDASRGSRSLAFGLNLEEGGVVASYLEDEVVVRNQGPVSVRYLGKGRWWVDSLILTTGARGMELCGVLSSSGEQDLFLRMATDFDLFGAEKEAFSILEGAVLTGEDPAVERRHPARCLPDRPLEVKGVSAPTTGFVHVTGSLTSPLLDGTLLLANIRARPRSGGMDIRIDDGSAITLRTALQGGVRRQTVVTSRPIRGSLGEGSFSLAGRVSLSNWRPDSLALRFDGVNLDYAPTQELRTRLNAELALVGKEIGGDMPTLGLSGSVQVVDGVYFAQSAVGSKLISRTTGQRKLSASSQPIVDTFPWIAPTTLDVDFEASNFDVKVSLPFGETDMELRADGRVRGTIADPELFGRVDVVPGGMILSSVINRDFEVVKGQADFSGDPARPTVIAEVQTEVTYQEDRGTDPYGSSDQVLSTFSTTGPEDKTVVIRATIEGTASFDEPGRELEDFDLRLTSDSGGYGQAELVPLLVSGVPPGQSAEYTAESGASIPLLTDELTSALTGSLVGAFVDDVTFGVKLQGGVDWGVRKLVGDSLKVEVRGQQDDTGQSVRPQFEFKISDRLSLEGSLRYFQQGTQAGDQVYETKLRYRIPLD